MFCTRCNHEILPGQIYRRWPRPHHIACPTAREVKQALRWGRWL
jgi:hypothetical protein